MSAANELMWQCIHCHKTLPGQLELPYCPFCRKPQQDAGPQAASAERSSRREVERKLSPADLHRERPILSGRDVITQGGEDFHVLDYASELRTPSLALRRDISPPFREHRSGRGTKDDGHIRRDTTLQGLTATPDRALKLTFHVIVPLSYWDWTRVSRVFIQFHHRDLGGCRSIGDFKSVRGDADFLEMSCTFDKFNCELLENPVAYKYIVKWSGDQEECEEHIYSCASHNADVKRCLRLPKEKLKRIKSIGEYHKYDTVIYPKGALQEVNNGGDRVLPKKIVELLRFPPKQAISKEAEDHEMSEPHYQSANEISRFCFRWYLNPYTTMICKGSFVQNVSLYRLKEDIGDLYSTIFDYPIMKSDDVCSANDGKGSTGVGQEEFVFWLERVVKYLDENPLCDAGQQLTAAFFIVLLYNSFALGSCNKEFVEMVVRMLALRPNVDFQGQYEFLLSCLPPNKRKHFAEYLGTFCAMVPALKPDEEQIKEYMMALPLYHFLQGLSKPFALVEREVGAFGRLKSQANVTGLDNMKTCVKELVKKFAARVYPSMESFFILDPLLYYVFIYIAPETEFSEVCKFISPSLTVAYLLFKATNTKAKQLISDVSEWISHIQVVKKSVDELNSLRQLCSVRKIATSLLLAFACVRSELIVSVLKEILSFIVYVLSKHDALHAQSTSNDCVCQEDREHIPEIVNNAIEPWIKSIGGPVLGGNTSKFYHAAKDWKRKAKSELQVWSTLLTVNTSFLDVDWYVIILKELICKRISDLKPDKLLELVCLLDDDIEKSSVLTDIVMEVSFKAIDHLQEKPSDMQVELFTTSKSSSQIGILLGRILLKQYDAPPQDIKNISLDNLLEWHLWPSVISILLTNTGIKDKLPEECFVAAKSAKSCLNGVVDKLFKKKIRFTDLRKICKHKEQMKRLCQAASSTNDKVKLSLPKIETEVDLGFQEMKEFEHRRTSLSHLCRLIESETDDIQGLSDLHKELQKDYNEKSIDKLWYRDSSRRIHLHCFVSAGKLRKFVDEFYQVTCEPYCSDLFKKEWHDTLLRVISEEADLIIDQIFELVWIPCKDSCQYFLKSVIDQSMTLAKVDEHFSVHECDVETQLTVLFKGIKSITKAFTDEHLSEVEIAAQKIREYWKLWLYYRCSDAVVKVKESLMLMGDFDEVHTLSVKLYSSMKDKSLKDVDKRLLKEGKFLKDIVVSRRIDCLEKLANCSDIIQWLKRETKGVSDIQNFVSVSLATAAGGEGDLVHDRLSNLRTVGSGFASLLYKLPETSSCCDLLKACAPVWNALNDYPALPELLEVCNCNISWYRSVKGLQGSVEVSSYGQMKNILSYGCYYVGNLSQSTPGQSIHDLISLKLETGSKKLDKTHYSLEELRDLESRLVLITGSKAENRTEVDHYLNILQHVHRIAELLLALQKSGNVSYLQWMMTSSCSKCFDCHGPEQEPKLNAELAANHVTELLSCAKDMENAFIQWKDDVKDSRSKYYELNYYTTLQLHELRNAFGVFKQESNRNINPEVVDLLQSISPNIASCDLHQVIDCHGKVSSKAKTGHVDMPVSVQTIMACQGAKVNIAGSSTYGIDPIVAGSSTDSGADTKAENSNSKISPQASVSAAKPNLSEEQLNDEQKTILTNLIEFFGYSKLLVLKAFEECPNSKNYQYIVQQWCDKNEADYTFEQTGESVNVYDESESESEDEPDEYESSRYLLFSGSRTISDRKVDESHPMVKRLVNECKYDIPKAVEAVMLNEDFETALNYLSRRVAIDVESKPTPQIFSKQGHCVHIHNDREFEKQFLSLDDVGSILGKLSEQLPECIKDQRTLRADLEAGSPNLIVVSEDDLLRMVLSLYMEDKVLPLPTPEEVLICTSVTSFEEVNNFWHRAVGDPGFRRIFCLVHAEKLPYHICDEALEALKNVSKGKQEYRLVIVCSKEGEERSLIVSKLFQHKKSVSQNTHTDDAYKLYLRRHFIERLSLGHTTAVSCITASVADFEKSCVRVVSSLRSGMGKSLYIQRMAQKLDKNATAVCVTIPIHGPSVTADVVLTHLKDHYHHHKKAMIYHFDIAPSALSKVDKILFSLLILRCLTNSEGLVWRCHYSQLYAVEVTLPENKDETISSVVKFLQLLPTVECLNPIKVKSMEKKGISGHLVGIDMQQFQTSTYQRVCTYLKKHDTRARMDSVKYQRSDVIVDSKCLQLLLKYCGIKSPSWSEIHHFTKFLDLQLESCENSTFCDYKLVGDILAGLKGFVVEFMIRMSKDFATPSLRIEVERDNQANMSYDRKYDIDHGRFWDGSHHHYIFFNKDRVTFTFIGFSITPKGDLLHKKKVVENRIISKDLFRGLEGQRVNLSDDESNWSKMDMIKKISTMMGVDCNSEDGFRDPDQSYVVTSDNLIKMFAIQTRFQCGIPVIIIGETGCGKTRLIRYMCDLAKQNMPGKNLLTMKVHGGTAEEDIRKFVSQAENQIQKNKDEFICTYVEKAMKRVKTRTTVDKVTQMKSDFKKDAIKRLKLQKMDMVIFFDEANTTEAIGLIKEIMCDRRCLGKPISDELRFIAACNPYRRHSDEMVKKLESAGLGFYIKATESHQKLGNIPLRQLVYRVHDIPRSMRPFVYDFGVLHEDAEILYIQKIVANHIKNHPSLERYPALVPAVARVLSTSQAYMKSRKDECSFVSLRDVQRAMIVFEFFFERIDGFRKADRRKSKKPLGDVTSALILALSVCYHSRLQDRSLFETRISKAFQSPLTLSNAKQFRAEIEWCQNMLLDNMKLGPNIAKNAALRENVFMMVICIELRIPLFLVGKPGSSKSLAKSIIQDSLLGKNSSSNILKSFKPVQMFSYQCSQLSTSESIGEVFRSAKIFQDQADGEYTSVVVLDEVGLAEDSPRLPLKILHPLLEDGTDGTNDEILRREERVAFIGISNWALDPAKMNRGVMVTRGIPDIHELEFSARGICGKEDNDQIRKKLQPYFRPLAEAYQEICEKQEREFFGLRDFYSLIKMLYWMCKKTKSGKLTWHQMKHAIMRNFGGWESDKVNPFEEFKKRLNMDESELNPGDYDKEEWSIVNPDCSKLGLIRTSLSTREHDFHGENRYLLFLTENYAALHVLEHYIQGENPNLNITESGECSNVGSSQKLKPYTLFGSSFPKDKEYTQICRNINQVKICMETGRTIILLNLEILYESLYDLLNQYYLEYSGNRYVDLGLQTHRVKCRVHPDFKLILIAERKTVYDIFPIPLINRLEKHFVLTSSVLESWQNEVLQEFEDWIIEFSTIRGGDGNFNKSHAFVGYQRDTAAAVVFQSSRQLESLMLGNSSSLNTIKESIMFEGLSVEDLQSAEEKGSQVWKRAVLMLSQYLLLQTATDDAIVRLEKTSLAEQQKKFIHIYFSEQHHNSVVAFVKHHLKNHSDSHEALLMQVTTHSHLLLRKEVEDIGESIKMSVEPLLLHEFDTELEFSNKLGPIFQKKNCLVVLQCDSGHLNGDLVACARHRIYDEQLKAQEKNEDCVTYILFIISLPHQFLKSSFTSFQGDPWISAHIDDLNPSTGAVLHSQQAISSTISELFIGGYLSDANFVNDIRDEYTIFESTEGCQLSKKPISTSQSSILTVENVYINSDSVAYDLTDIPKKRHECWPAAQCCRIRNCIQAAASKVEDSTERRTITRVSLLTKLIPRKPPHRLSNDDFYSILVVRMFKLLKEREYLRPDLSEWVLKEALSSTKLQLGGTFRNVLARKVDDVIIPLLAKIIAYVDHNYNLDLIDPKSPNSACKQFWLSMFSNPKVTLLEYSEMVQGDKLPGIGGRMFEQTFKCKMPFFWIIKAAVDSAWDNAKRYAVEGVKSHLTQLCEIVRDTVVGGVLESVNQEDCEEFFGYYLHDFVKSVHFCAHKSQELNDLEYKLVGDSLSHNMMVICPSMKGKQSLGSKIAALHLVYKTTEAQSLLFGQVVSIWPSIIKDVEATLSYEESILIELHLHAAKHVMVKLEPPLETDDPNLNLKQWLSYIHLSQTPMDSILSIKSNCALLDEIRLHWQKLSAMKMFVECIVLQYPELDLKIYARRLSAILKQVLSFEKADTLETIKYNLNNLEVQLKTHNDRNLAKQVKQSCRDFFFELVSNLCFDGQAVPEPLLIEMLIRMVFDKDGESSQSTIAPSKRDKADKTLTVRSFLLQLLLEYSTDRVRQYVKDYLTESTSILAGRQEDQDIYLMIVQCFEDSIFKNMMTEKFSDRIQQATILIKEGQQELQKFHKEKFQLEYLEGVSKVRFCLSLAAEILSSFSEMNSDSNVKELLQAVEDVCKDSEINRIDVVDFKNVEGPVAYLVKVLAKQYGIPCLKSVAEAYTWVIPPVLRPKQFGKMDPFVLYSELYKEMRKAVGVAVQTGQTEQLYQVIHNQDDRRDLVQVYITLSLYDKVTLSRERCDFEVLRDNIDRLDRFVKNYYRSSGLLHAARALLANQQGGKVLEQMVASPRQQLKHKLLTGLVVHSATVFISKQKSADHVLLPFTNILNNPAALKRSYLPTMQEDAILDVKEIMVEKNPQGQFYECPRGHIYFIGECGRAWTRGKCSVCRADIGGGDHKLTRGNKRSKTKDKTNRGHDLGPPQARVIACPERSLSARAVCIMRALMHSAFIWAWCNNKRHQLSFIASLIYPRVPAEHLPEFFWKHLEKDIDLLCGDTRKGIDYVVMIIHLVLGHILTTNPPTGHDVQINSLLSKDDRRQWEDIFQKHYIQPVLSNLDHKLSLMMQAVTNDEDKLEYHANLINVVNERTEESFENNLWVYRSRVTLEHLTHTLQQKEMIDKYPILHEFLHTEVSLRATTYLPDIARLHRYLYDMFNHQIDTKDARSQTIGQFINELPNETMKTQCSEMIDSFYRAWRLVGYKLKTHGRLPVDEKYYIPVIDESSPIEYLIPTTSGAGVCSCALVDLLALSHNSFIQKCRNYVVKKNQSTLSFWREHKIPMSHLHPCHVLNYVHQLPSIILSHCHYSLRVGRGQEVVYDYQALEKHIMNRFINGKPLISLDILQVVYRKEVCTTGTFSDVRKKVEPQEILPRKVKNDIIAELCTPDRLRTTLDVIEIVLGFLSSSGGMADRSLGVYIDKTLKMKSRHFSQEAKESCQLKHILSLWNTVAVELAKQLYIKGQEPFDLTNSENFRDLSEDEEGEDQKAALKQCLNHVDPDVYLGIIYEFIETYIKQAPYQEYDQPLMETMQLVYYDDSSFNEDWLKEFPSTIKLDQAIAAWKYIVDCGNEK